MATTGKSNLEFSLGAGRVRSPVWPAVERAELGVREGRIWGDFLWFTHTL